MKKSLVLVVSFLLPFMLCAQDTAEKFEITPEGFTQTVTREYPGKTDSELFEAVREWAEYTIANTEESLKNQLNDQFLKYRAFVPQGIRVENESGVSDILQWDVLLDVAFRINNQKITYEVDIIELSSPDAGPFALKAPPAQWSFFDMQDQPRGETASAREQINNIANDFIRGVSSYVNQREERGEVED